jgi:hypothetical protein
MRVSGAMVHTVLALPPGLGRDYHVQASEPMIGSACYAILNNSADGEGAMRIKFVLAIMLFVMVP